jgi:hypothetical protein
MAIVDSQPKSIRVRHKDPFAGYTNAGPAPKLDPPYHFTGESWVEIKAVPQSMEELVPPGGTASLARIFRPLPEGKAGEAVAWDDSDIEFFRGLAARNPGIWEIEVSPVKKVIEKVKAAVTGKKEEPES